MKAFVSLFSKSYGAPLSSYMHIKLHKDETGAWFTLKITHSIQTTDMRQNVSFFSSRMSKVKQISVWTATAISLLFVNILTLNSKTLDFIDRLENMNIFYFLFTKEKYQNKVEGYFPKGFTLQLNNSFKLDFILFSFHSRLPTFCIGHSTVAYVSHKLIL